MTNHPHVHDRCRAAASFDGERCGVPAQLFLPVAPVPPAIPGEAARHHRLILAVTPLVDAGVRGLVAPLRRAEWVVYVSAFGGTGCYLSRLPTASPSPTAG
jgi:hypothetical protein